MSNRMDYTCRVTSTAINQERSLERYVKDEEISDIKLANTPNSNNACWVINLNLYSMNATPKTPYYTSTATIPSYAFSTVLFPTPGTERN